jgi:hypothetical protein
MKAVEKQSNNSRKGKYTRDWEVKPHRIIFTASTSQAEQIRALTDQKGFTRAGLIRDAINSYLAKYA